MAHERGEETRQRLIDAAIDIFGRYGFDGASTRLLAERAGVNLAAIPYHFGGKQGLHLAVAEHIAGQIEQRAGPLLTRIEATMEADASLAACREALHQILLGWADIMLGSTDAARWARFMVREQMDPSPAFEVLYERIIYRCHWLCCRLLARLLDRNDDDEEIQVRMFALFGQILIFRLGRGTTSRRLGWEEMSKDHIAVVRRVIAAHLDAILDREISR